MRWSKRAIDLCFSSVGLALTSVLFGAIALAVRLTSPGPIFYRQRRAGAVSLDGEGRPIFTTFDMFKFRTMRVDAERRSGPVLASENDPRVTPVGRFLRRTRLDELPQLWNVLRGDMSLVGPRPERPELLENLVLAIPFFEERARAAKPGITGLAQVSLGYTGRALPDSPIKDHEPGLLNPYSIDEADGALADDMRMKLLFDLAYVTSLDRFATFMRTELYIILRTPLVMLRGFGR